MSPDNLNIQVALVIDPIPGYHTDHDDQRGQYQVDAFQFTNGIRGCRVKLLKGRDILEKIQFILHFDRHGHEISHQDDRNGDLP